MYYRTWHTYNRFDLKLGTTSTVYDDREVQGHQRLDIVLYTTNLVFEKILCVSLGVSIAVRNDGFDCLYKHGELTQIYS